MDTGKELDLLKVLADFDEGVIIADREGRIIFYNRTMGKIDDLDPQDVAGKKVTDIYELSTENSIIYRCLNSGQPIINDPLIYRAHFGKTAYTLDSVLPLFQRGKLVGAICFVKDYNLLQSGFDAARQATLREESHSIAGKSDSPRLPGKDRCPASQHKTSRAKNP